MKNKWLLVLTVIGFYDVAWSEPSLVTVELKNDEKKTFVLAESPVFQYRNDSLVVNGNASTSYLFDEVRKYYFSGGNAGIPNIESNEVRVTYVDNQHVQVEGLKENSRVGIFSLLGQSFDQKVSKNGESLQFTIPDAKGVYILRINEQSIKLIKE
ncbi:MAG: T9SS type A sorting domain-containing protein [Paludibacteraceae bacterium]|nr:T9SS type A sorting domain-containing protein [Paludibacteraceae bacterium]